MLVLSRRIGEEIVVPSCDLSIKVLDVGTTAVRLGIAAPDQVPIHRKEVWERIRRESRPAAENRAVSLRVLLADPNEYLLMQYQEHLAAEGFEVFTAADGLECLEQLRTQTPDILILEPIMPWGGGDGVLAMMKAEADVPRTPVLILTSGTQPGVLYNISSFDINDFQKKPFSAKRLAARILRILDRRPLKFNRV
ncbi:MAG: carbon storage regulator [Pirellulales bacterium]|nr:carbon storage regulator [Pirellulales bacterium]